MPYLSLTEYLDRFGERETIAATNDTPGATTYDSAKVDSALADAEALVEGYIGTRYTVPLIDVPRIVKGWVAALAREQLYTRHPPQQVKDNADIARSQLQALSLGRIDLPVADGQTPPTSNPSGSARTSGDAMDPTFSRLKQAEYMAPFTGGYATPCWKRGT